MAINFTDSPADGATQVIGGRTYTYNSAKNKWDTTATEVVGPTATVYATVDNLPGTATTGDQAFVSGTNRLYIWNGSGWYNIALVNSTPTISGVSSSYALAIDGTATTVTITATDPEGLPITYSIASDTSGNIATVTQGTGANTNVFTITPSTNTAYAGSFTLTFRASDGVNLATAPASFTLQFSVENSRYTSSLITSVGANNAVNNSFVDSSTNSHTITVTGDATQTTFSPYRHGGYSTYFDGSGDYLTVPSHASMSLDADFTIEYWIYNATSGNNYIFTLGDSYTSTGIETYIGSSGGQFNLYSAGASQISSATKPTVNAWSHVAIVRSGSTITLYLDGASLGTWTSSATFSGNAHIAQEYYNGAITGTLNGYLTDVRIVKGTAVYTSAFTPPTQRLTAITNTGLLTCHLPYIADGSTNAHGITVNGNTKTVPFAPYDYQEYSSSSHGGSMYFDGTGDRLTFSHASDFSFGTGDFTIEFWIKSPTNAIVGGYSRVVCEIGQFKLYLRITQYHGGTDGALLIHDGSTGVDIGGTVSLSDDRWHHVAVVRESGTAKCWVDGAYMSGVSHTTSLSETGTNAVGSQADGNGPLQGHVSDLRVVKGTAVYTGTSNFTPPTTPLTAITNTSLLLSGTNAGIIDKSQSIKDYKNSGSISSTAQTKYLSSSIYFDGVNDYARWTNNDGLFDLGFNGEPFTIEHWHYLPSIVNGASLGIQTGGGAGAWNGSDGHQLTIFFYSSAATLFYQWWNGSGRTDYEFNHGGAFTAGTWQHFATVYDGTNLSTYVDGTRIGHRTSGNTFGSVTTKYASLGSNATTNQGLSEIYYSDVRVTKGLARYSGTSFTPPTEALQG